ncbi:MAG: response regulator [Planctomycetota bacterium]|nr:response regulator [Planctomycetota bacterium]
MPNGDGRYVLESLRACEATKHIPVIVLTGHRADDRKQEMLSLGADSYLVKPTPFDTLFSTLLPHLGLPASEACYDH